MLYIYQIYLNSYTKKWNWKCLKCTFTHIKQSMGHYIPHTHTHLYMYKIVTVMFLLYICVCIKYVHVLPLFNWRSARVLTVSVATTGDTRMHRYDYIRYCPARLIISLCIIDLFFMYYYININNTIVTDTHFTTYICTHNTRWQRGWPGSSQLLLCETAQPVALRCPPIYTAAIVSSSDV